MSVNRTIILTTDRAATEYEKALKNAAVKGWLISVKGEKK